MNIGTVVVNQFKRVMDLLVVKKIVNKVIIIVVLNMYFI